MAGLCAAWGGGIAHTGEAVALHFLHKHDLIEFSKPAQQSFIAWYLYLLIYILKFIFYCRELQTRMYFFFRSVSKVIVWILVPWSM